MNDLTEYYAVVLVPTRIAFKTNASPEQLTEVAHNAASNLPSESGYQPLLLECYPKTDGDELATPPIDPRAA